MDQTNCKNCGAALHFDREKRLAICNYCGTEYHLDNLGRIEEYMVELEIMGKRRKFYISSVTYEPVYSRLGRSVRGEISCIESEPIITLELISY